MIELKKSNGEREYRLEDADDHEIDQYFRGALKNIQNNFFGTDNELLTADVVCIPPYTIVELQGMGGRTGRGVSKFNPNDPKFDPVTGARLALNRAVRDLISRDEHDEALMVLPANG